jgi:ATP-dependent DNA helicase
MSAEDTDTFTDSRAGTIAPESTVPSSPLTNPTEAEDSKSSVDKDDHPEAELTDGEDVEEMDSKAKALMHLLKTSSVSVESILLFSDYSGLMPSRTCRFLSLSCPKK